MAMVQQDLALEAPDPQLRQLVGARVFALDSTTIDLCLALFPWALFRRNKAGVKLHTLFDVDRQMPTFILITRAKTHDVNALDHIPVEPGAFYVLDRAYVDYARLWRIHCAPAFFVTRCKKNMTARVIKRQEVPVGGAIVYDCQVRLRGAKSRARFPDTLRIIKYKDPETGKILRFLTNCHTLDAQTIALLYKKRWQIELFFKWIKQNLQIKGFYGYTFNAVATQVWVAVMAFVLVRRVKIRLDLKQSPGEIFQTLSVNLLQKVPVFELFSAKQRPFQPCDDRNQLTLFKI